jgi:hypothetical protein
MKPARTINPSKETSVQITRRGDVYDVVVRGADDEKIIQAIVGAIGSSVGTCGLAVVEHSLSLSRSQ